MNINLSLWPNFQYPAQFDEHNIHTCEYRHYIPKSHSNPRLWKYQLQYWSNAIENYSQQLLYNCPYIHRNKLTFTIDDIKFAYARQSDGMRPVCIGDIVRHFIDTKIITRENIISPQYHSYLSSVVNTASNYFQSLKSITGFAAEEFTRTDTSIDDDYKDIELVWIPSLHSICLKIENIANNMFNIDINSNLEELAEMIDVGVIQSEKNTANECETIVNGCVFEKYCISVLHLTMADIFIIKYFLIEENRMNVYYINDSKNSKNEFLKFKAKHCKTVSDITDANVHSMIMISTHLIIKYLKIQQRNNEQNLHKINFKLKEIMQRNKGRKVSNTLKDTMQMQLISKRKLLKNSIQKIMICISKFDKIVCAMDDQKLNANVFKAMKNANHNLKNSALVVDQIQDLYKEINENMMLNSEISEMLAEPIIKMDDMEVEFEEKYDQMLMDDIEKTLPNAPNHEIINKLKADEVNTVNVSNLSRKQMQEIFNNLSTAQMKKILKGNVYADQMEEELIMSPNHNFYDEQQPQLVKITQKIINNSKKVRAVSHKS